jgi:hypothetical protein
MEREASRGEAKPRVARPECLVTRRLVSVSATTSRQQQKPKQQQQQQQQNQP